MNLLRMHARPAPKAVGASQQGACSCSSHASWEAHPSLLRVCDGLGCCRQPRATPHPAPLAPLATYHHLLQLPPPGTHPACLPGCLLPLPCSRDGHGLDHFALQQLIARVSSLTAAEVAFARAVLDRNGTGRVTLDELMVRRSSGAGLANMAVGQDGCKA